MPDEPKRFAVAVSFPGEHRPYVLEVAERLAEVLGRERIFYDEWYEAELLGVDGDLKLRRYYREQSDVVVPFFCEDYEKDWCQIEWSAIRDMLKKRRKENAVIPVQLDDTEIEGWGSIDFAIQGKGRSAREIADVILAAYRHRFPDDAVNDPVAGQIQPHHPLLRDLERAIDGGNLQDSELAHDVLAILRSEKNLKPAEPLDANWCVLGILTTENYLASIQNSAGELDWERDFAKIATPVLVGVAWSLARSPQAQAAVLQLCDRLAARLRLQIIWPADPDEANDVKNAIYRTCLNADELSCDDLLLEFQSLRVAFGSGNQ